MSVNLFPSADVALSLPSPWPKVQIEKTQESVQACENLDGKACELSLNAPKNEAISNTDFKKIRLEALLQGWKKFDDAWL